MYDSILVVSFGGPEKADDVIPFLENVTRGRGVPRERLLKVAEHYYHFGGRSPINDQCRELIMALHAELNAHNIHVPIYWGNRNWHPFLANALREMQRDHRKHALGLVTSAYSSYSSCRQYREDIAAAQAEVGEGAPQVDKLRAFYNHPGFIEASVDQVRKALAQFSDSGLAQVRFVATAHSIPCSAAQTSDYQKQLGETTRLIAEAVGFASWDLVFQSRSGPPAQPWLGPDILDHLRSLKDMGVENVLVVPLGFISDHLEVLYDLDTNAQQLARELGMKMVRASTVGCHPKFIQALRQLISERFFPEVPRLAVGRYGPNHDLCPADCCPAPRAGRPVVSEDPSVSRPS